MEEDLEFLINALSVPNTPLTEPYDEGQLLEMRETFKTVQKLIRSRPAEVEESLRQMPRSKAGGDTGRVKDRNLNSMLALMDSDCSRGSPAWTSADSGALTSPIISECGLRGMKVMGQNDTDLESSQFESDEESHGALVPYEELYTDKSASETTLTGESSVSSTISFSIPMQVVWSNSDYSSQVSDSETTITADGHRFSLMN
ncbi:uncharacterized protein [Drosophila bipectinata]|uniref:uncharacterized protein n=1 Tax=Drosophila bipectinata TaxID=42026 RepID=UPI001C89F1CC|nr:uncharacterized protein LOC108126795 [Drosophila bipectinata]